MPSAAQIPTRFQEDKSRDSKAAWHQNAKGRARGPAPVLVILEAQDTIMVTTFIMMTTGVEEGRARLLLPLV